ncbi:uncharacterized protein BKA78DRAFT_314408 [Phyllosticta capitalensis]|uniref:uncharacterized protein n=1 Tax=Phyllosticta capitalensis TaxID=121624 RepID=UPI003131099A
MDSWEAISDECKPLAHPNLGNFGLSIFILLGILVSYLPQHAKIILRRSSEGLSPWFVLLGTTSGTSAIANILVLPKSRSDIGCCDEIGGFPCAAALLGIAQVGVQWSCFFLIMLLFLVFFPRDQTTAVESSPEDENRSPYTIRQALGVVVISIVHFLVVFLVSVILLGRFPEKLQLWANILGIMATCLASIQYLPQIWTTWRLQHVYSLSIPMMLIQTPGSFVWATSLAVRLGPSGWSAWGVYIVTGCLQGVLLAMGIWFWFRDRKLQKGVTGNGVRSSVSVSWCEMLTSHRSM